MKPKSDIIRFFIKPDCDNIGLKFNFTFLQPWNLRMTSLVLHSFNIPLPHSWNLIELILLRDWKRNHLRWQMNWSNQKDKKKISTQKKHRQHALLRFKNSDKVVYVAWKTPYKNYVVANKHVFENAIPRSSSKLIISWGLIPEI